MKDNRITISLSDEAFDYLQKATREDHRSVSNWIDKKILEDKKKNESSK